MDLQKMMDTRGLVLPDKSTHQHFTNNPMEFIVSVYPMCNIEKIDDKIDDEIVHIESSNYPFNKLNPQFRMGITMNAEISHITEPPTDQEQLKIWELNIC